MVTITEICKKTGKKKAAVSLFISRNNISAVVKSGHHKYFDENVEPLASYMGRKAECVSNRNTEIKPEPEIVPEADNKPVKQRQNNVNTKMPSVGKHTTLNDGFKTLLKYDGANAASLAVRGRELKL